MSNVQLNKTLCRLCAIRDSAVRLPRAGLTEEAQMTQRRHRDN